MIDESMLSLTKEYDEKYKAYLKLKVKADRQALVKSEKWKELKQIKSAMIAKKHELLRIEISNANKLKNAKKLEWFYSKFSGSDQQIIIDWLKKESLRTDKEIERIVQEEIDARFAVSGIPRPQDTVYRISKSKRLIRDIYLKILSHSDSEIIDAFVLVMSKNLIVEHLVNIAGDTIRDAVMIRILDKLGSKR